MKNDFSEILIGERLIIIPGNRKSHNDSDCTISSSTQNSRIELVLSRGAFGSGEHETTRSCLELMEGLELHQGSVLDFGCGTGILVVAALLLGARRGIAVDIAPDSVAICAENARLNQVSSRVGCVCGDIDNLDESHFDLVVANIFADILIQRKTQLIERVCPGGFLLLSGVHIEMLWETESAFEDPRLEILKKVIGDEFCTLLFKRMSDGL